MSLTFPSKAAELSDMVSRVSEGKIEGMSIQSLFPYSRRTVFDSQASNGTAAPAPQPGQTPVPPNAAHPTATGQPAAMNGNTPSVAPQTSVLQPVGIWRSTESRFGTSPITHFRRRISQFMAPPSAIPRDSEGPSIHVAAPTAEQTAAFQSLPWEALTMAQRQREIKTQPSLPSSLLVNPHSGTGDFPGATLRPLGSRNVSWDPSNGIESPWASHTPTTSQAPEVFSQIHATRVQTRSQSRLNGGNGLSRENSVSSSGTGPVGEAEEETTSPAQMAAMAALRRANQQRVTTRPKPTAKAVPDGSSSPLPVLQDEIAGAYEYWNVEPDNAGAHKETRQKRINAQLIPLFVDPAQDAHRQQSLHTPASAQTPLSPRCVMASIRWGVDQVRQSRRTGEDDEWRTEMDRLRQAHADLGTAITELTGAGASTAQ